MQLGWPATLLHGTNTVVEFHSKQLSEPMWADVCRCLTHQEDSGENNGLICFSSVSTSAKLRARKFSPVSLHSKQKTQSFHLQRLYYRAGVPCRKVQGLGGHGGKQTGAGQQNWGSQKRKGKSKSQASILLQVFSYSLSIFSLGNYLVCF